MTIQHSSSTFFTIKHEIRRGFVSATRKNLGILQYEWMIQGKVVSEHTTVNHHPSVQKTVIFLHGLLGNSKNLRNPAKRLTSEYPHLSALLIDLRGHGETARFNSTAHANTSSSSPSPHFLPPHTIRSCSSDILETLKYLSLTGPQFSPIAIIGHSLGGRVALQYLHDTLFVSPKSSHKAAGKEESNLHVYPPKQTWILDSVPGMVHSGVSKVIHAVSTIPMPISSKKALVTSLLQMGMDPTIANWMTTNLKESSTTQGMYDFTFDLQIAQNILHDFSHHDLFQVLIESLSQIQQQQHHLHDDIQNHQVYLIQAGKNDSWTPPIIQQMDKIQQLYPRHFQRVILPKAGHWVHVDDLNGLMNIIQSQFSH